MPEITGLISPAERGPFQEVLSRMAAVFPCREDCQTDTWMSDRAGFIVNGPGALESMLAYDDRCVLGLVGLVVEDENLQARLQRLSAHPAGPEIPQRLLALYEEQGAAALQGLNGAYTVAIWEAQPARLTLIGDRSGLQPFYYARAGREFVFSSRVQAIAAHPLVNRQVNPAAVFDLLAAEQMLDERTLFAEVQALPPAGLLTYQGGRLEVRSYWRPVLYQPGGPEVNEAEAIDELAGRVITAVGRRLAQVPQATSAGSPALCLLLTGGLDSRLLAAALSRCRKDRLVEASTIGHEMARDVRYGSEIAAATGLPHTVLPPNPRYLIDYAAESVRRTDAGINVHASWILGEIDYLRQAGIPAVMTGVGAEAVSGRHWLSDQPVTTRAGALNRLAEARWNFARASGLLRPEIRAEALAASRESLRRTLEEAPSDNLLGWADYFAYRQNRRHPTGSILAEDVLVLEPFFDNDLIDYAYALPAALRAKGRLYKKMIVQRFPEVAGIGYTDSGTLLVDEVSGLSARAARLSTLQNLARRANRRLARRLPFLRRPPFCDNPANAIYYNHWLRTAARHFVIDLLAREDLYADYLDAASVHALVDAHMSGRADEFRLIGGVVTFALWRDING